MSNNDKISELPPPENPIEVLVRRKEVLDCLDCGGDGEIRKTGYHNEVSWEECPACEGLGEVEEYVYYWVEKRTNTVNPDHCDGQRASRFSL